ncbi:hypothetical protein ACJA3J_15225 [Halobacillus sp. SY10]|uniref:hypothetical protein n=1 Tax=Halobacillus sp. SY10 TaxID=3381356 RepID=UPI00387A133A
MTEEKPYIATHENDKIEITGANMEHLKKDDQVLADTIDMFRNNPKVANTFIGNGVNIRVNDVEELTDEGSYFSEAVREVRDLSEFLNPTSVEVEEESIMSNSDHFDSFYKEIKDDMREREERNEKREERIRREIEQREDRFERSMDKYQQESKEREERFLDTINRIEGKMDNMDQNFNNRIDKLEENTNIRLDKSETKIEDIAKDTRQILTANIWGFLAFFAAMVAIIVTLMIQL